MGEIMAEMTEDQLDPSLVAPTRAPRIAHANPAHVVRFALIHLIGLVGPFVVGTSAQSWALCIGLYVFHMFFVTAGYHRYFSHRTFHTSRAFQFILAWFAQSTAQKGVIWWSRNHRHHHRFSDSPEDIHSPVQVGFFQSHVGWLFDETIQSEAKTVSDLERFPELRFLDKHWLLPPVLNGFLLWLGLGWEGLISGFFLSMVLVWHGTFTINSLTHVWGNRRFDTTDTSRNNPILALITLGEGWHNNHHHYMRSTRQGFAWYELDITYIILRGLALLRIVRDLREPPAEIMAAARR
jgi:stearoyl-CoA desaturase (delta-9 desaturase)